MRDNNWLQKILYLIMAVLGIYILYKGGNLLIGSRAAQSALDTGNVQRVLEDSAVRTYAPGYTAAVEGRSGGSWMASWMQQIVPVYSYLAEGQAEAGGQMDAGSQTEVEGEAKVQAKAEGQAETGGQGNAEDQVDAGGQGNAEDQVDAEGQGNAEDQADAGGQGNAGSQTDAQGQIEEEDFGKETEMAQEAAGRLVSDGLMEQLSDFNYLLGNYYTVDGGTSADADLLDAQTLLNHDLTIEQNPQVPQILIYHTHSQEAFADSREGESDDSVVGMGETLAQLLQNEYGYQVIHDTGVYDLVDGVLDRSAAYDYAREAVEQILEENPTIEVIIDLHRDGVEGQKFVTEIDGRPTSMIMFFNGISRDNLNQPLYWLENPYVEENLAFSLQLQLKAREQYPGFTRNIYLKAERFNLHLRPRSLLIEAGTQLNTVEEERNAMIPLADLLHQVLSGT